MTRPGSEFAANVTVSEPSQLAALHSWLARVPGIDVDRLSIEPSVGEQGAWDLLVVLAGSSGILATAIRSLPEFIRSKRSDIEVIVEVGEKKIVIRGSNVEDIPRMIGSIFDGE